MSIKVLWKGISSSGDAILILSRYGCSWNNSFTEVYRARKLIIWSSYLCLIFERLILVIYLCSDFFTDIICLEEMLKFRKSYRIIAHLQRPRLYIDINERSDSKIHDLLNAYFPKIILAHLFLFFKWPYNSLYLIISEVTENSALSSLCKRLYLDPHTLVIDLGKESGVHLEIILH